VGFSTVPSINIMHPIFDTHRWPTKRLGAPYKTLYNIIKVLVTCVYSPRRTVRMDLRRSV
jgi:hypothetical protein